MAEMTGGGTVEQRAVQMDLQMAAQMVVVMVKMMVVEMALQKGESRAVKWVQHLVELKVHLRDDRPAETKAVT